MARGREALLNIFSGLNLTARDSSGAAILPTGLNSFFQQSPLTSGALSNFYGSDAAFMQRFQGFEEEFFRTISDSTNLRVGQSVDVAAMQASGYMDLNVLSEQAKRQLKQKFGRNVMDFGGLIQRFGLPGSELPNSNLYRSPFRFRTLNQGDNLSPSVALLNSLTLNIDTTGRTAGVDSINIGGKIMTSRRLRELSDRSVYTDMFSGPGTKKIITFDTETTGLNRGAQVRSMAMAESTYENGILKSVSKVDGFNFAYDAPALGGLTVDTLNGGSQEMSKFLMQIEGADKIAENPAQFLDNANDFVKRMLEADMIAGHNVGFDIGMMDSTIRQTAGFQNHEIFGTMGRFYEKINAGGYIVDTADTARSYFINQVEAATGGITDLDDQAQRFIKGLYSPESLAKVTVGGSATYADVGNIVTNTNLIELIENVDNGVITQLKQGSHIAETDVILQSYVANFIQTGELKIRSLNPGIASTTTGDEIRRIVARSSAITPTTNIADVEHMSAATKAYAKTNEGLKGAVAMVGPGDEKSLGLVGNISEGGHLRYMNGGYQYVSGQGAGNMVQVDSGLARQFLTDVIDSRSKKLMSSGVNYMSQSAANQIMSQAGISVATDPDSAAVINAFGSFYENYGSGVSPGAYRDYRAGRGTITPFGAGLNPVNQVTARSVTEAFAAAGDPLAGFGGDVSRAFTTAFAKATAKVGMEEGAKLGLAMTQHADLMAEGGIAYFRTMNNRVAGLPGIGTPSRVQLPTAVVREAAERAGAFDGGFGGLTYSFVDEGEDLITANVVYNPTKDLSSAQRTTFYGAIQDIMSNAQEVSRVTGLEQSEFDSTLKASINSFANGGDDVASMIDLANENGILIGSTEVDRSLQDEVAQMLRTESANDVNMRHMAGRSVSLGEEADRGLLAVAYSADEKALAISGQGQNAADLARQKVVATEKQAAIVAENEAAVRRKVGRGLTGMGENKLLNAFDAVRPKAGLIGIGVAAATAGYYMNKRRQEVSLYNETLEAQPYEKSRNTYQQNRSAAQFVDVSSTRYDPLNTAGTVGNLDRSKIGHTHMGNRKNDHLFRGV